MEQILKQLEGWQTIETIQEELKIKEQSAINLVSRIRKAGYLKNLPVIR